MKQTWQSGQSLLVIVLLISVVFTLIASASYRLTTETQSAKIQEESVRTLAAADSGVERGLQMLKNISTGTFPFSHASVAISLQGIDSAKSFVKIDSSATDNFFNITIPVNEQYTFYLYQYPDNAGFFIDNLDIYFGPSSLSCNSGRATPALEFTLIYGANLMQKWIAEPCTTNPQIIVQTGGIAKLPLGPGSARGTPPITYGHRIDFDSLDTFSNPKLLIVRSLYEQTNIRFESQPNTINLPNQGKNITSTAISNTGVSKVVKLFRSNPQIPADFFVTQF